MRKLSGWGWNIAGLIIVVLISIVVLSCRRVLIPYICGMRMLLSVLFILLMLRGLIMGGRRGCLGLRVGEFCVPKAEFSILGRCWSWEALVLIPKAIVH